jgi:hypothetical protein
VRLDRPSAGLLPMLAAPLCAALFACLGAVPAAAAPTLGWSRANIDEGRALNAVSCASETLCVAVDEAGRALLSTDPNAEAGATWSRREIDSGRALSAVSCASTSLCVAVDGEGGALVSTDPTAGAASNWNRVAVPGAGDLTGVSCASTSLCVAVDANGDAYLSTNPTENAGATSSWSSEEIDRGHALSSVSCASTSLCVAVDGAGRALASHEPVEGESTWRPSPIDLSLTLVAVSCAPAPAGLCVAVDGAGDALASGDPTGEAPTWSWTPIETLELGAPTAVSCAAAGLCVAVDSSGGAFASDSPAGPAPAWTFAGIDEARLSGVSCVAEGLCAAVDRTGRVLVTRVPPPAVATGAPSALGETSATLTGAVDPEDALAECHFEYGPSEAYGRSAPCTAGVAGGAAQGVSAAVSELAPNTTYHFRLVASSASGTQVSADATFKTLAPPLVQPHPSIGGTPAPGQRLTCKSGVSGSATVGYAWLRDTQTIAGATGSTYLVTGADVSHHLQCRVSATNAAGTASATSAFVTVPAGGLGQISETQVGAPRVSGATVSVPLTCSAQAAGSCTITLRLTVVETLRGGHPVAVAARRARRVTVTVGASTVHLAASQRRTVTVALNATGRRLLAHLRRLAARLSVSGTVVGAVSASLRSATVTLVSGSKASSRKASRHRR